MKLKVDGISFRYESTNVLEEILFEVKEGEILGIIGPNGSGKTTLLNCINLRLRPMKGTILINEKDIRDWDRREIARSIGIVPQNTAIHFPFTVLDVVLMGRTPHIRRFGRECLRDFDIVRNAMKITNTLHLADKPIDEVSGGEKQRVIVAGALAQEPRILLLDEPTLHLDINHQLEILELIQELARKRNLIVILVSHDLNLASRYCNRLVLMNSGSIYAIGSTMDVLTEDNIREVYGINIEINYIAKLGFHNIIPLGLQHDETLEEKRR